MSLWMTLTGVSTLINPARNSCIIVLVTFPRWDCCLPRWLIAYSSEVLMQSYNPGIERDRVTAEFLKGLEDENRDRRRNTLEAVGVVCAAILAWNVYKHGKRP